MNPTRHWKPTFRGLWHTALLGSACVLLSACLPEDEILNVRFAPDGRTIAMVTQKTGINLVHPADTTILPLVSENFETPELDWSPNGKYLAFTTNANGNADIATVDMDGNQSLLTGSPARETSPLWLSNDSLLFLAGDSGRFELFQWSGDEGTTGPLLDFPSGIVALRLSHNRTKLAFWTVEDLRPQLYVMDLSTSHVARVTSETEPLSLLIGSQAWTGDDALLVLRNSPAGATAENHPVADAHDGRGEGEDFHLLRGTHLSMLSMKRGTPVEMAIAEDAAGIAPPPPMPSTDSVVFVAGERLIRQKINTGEETTLPLAGFQISHPSVTPGGDQVAFGVEKQLLGTARADLKKARLHTFSLEDKLLLAEEYLRKDLRGESASVYRELAESVRRTGDPAMLRFLSIVNHGRLGNTGKVAEELEEMLREGKVPEQIPPHLMWRVLGFTHLIGTEKFEKAQLAFLQYTRLHNQDLGTSSSSRTDSAKNALEILQQDDPVLARQYAAAVRARLEANLQATDQAFAKLLELRPDLPAIQSEYLRGLEGYEQDVYYYSPSQREFQPSNFYRINYLERFLKLCPEAQAVADVKLSLFLLLIEQRQFARARELLREALQAPEIPEGVEGVTEVFANYLETPESQPWLEAAMEDVFLHATIRPTLEERVEDEGSLFLADLAAVKLALTRSRPNVARVEADKALARWQRLEADGEMSPRMMTFYARLRVMRAREAELRGLYAEAAGLYDEAREWISDNHVGDFEMYVDVKYRSALLRHLLSDDTSTIPQMLERERLGGDELVNPTWENDRLTSALQAVLPLYDAAEHGAQRAVLAYESAILLRKLHRPWQARAALLEAAGDLAPVFVRERAYIEMASLDENGGDPWNSGRWYGRAAGLPVSDHYLQEWLSYHLARQNLKIGYNVAAAREALGLLLQTNETTPLGIHVEELLSTTDTGEPEEDEPAEEED